MAGELDPATDGVDRQASDIDYVEKTWREIHIDEEARILRRRGFLQESLVEGQAIRLPDKYVGLALSGGGIRSATFSVGVLRSLSRLGLAHKIDYLSTVSGGGYAASFYCSLFVPDILRGVTPSLERPAIERVSTSHVAMLTNDPLGSERGREAIGRLRDGGHYLMPAGTTDTFFAAVIAFRNWLAVALITGLAILAFFLMINLVRIPDKVMLPDPMAGWTLHETHIPFILRDARLIFSDCAAAAGSGGCRCARHPAGSGSRGVAGQCIQESPSVGFGASYLWLLALLVIPLWPQPCAWAYWMTRGSPVPRTLLRSLLNPSAIVALLCAGAALTLLLWDRELRASPIALTLGLAAILAGVLGVLYYVLARLRVTMDDHRRPDPAYLVEAVDALRVAKENRIRTKLGRWLYRGFIWSFCLAMLALVDDLGRIMYNWAISPGGRGLTWESPAWLTVVIAGLVPVARWLLAQGQASKVLTWPRLGPLLRRFGRSIALVVALILLFFLLSFWAAISYELVWHDRPVVPGKPFTSWASIDSSAPWWPPVAIALFVAACAFILGHVRSFLNQSSLASFYAGRLRKAYLGATNAERDQEQDRYPDVEHPKDDIGLLAYYHPNILAPLHLINVTVNETTAASSRVIQRDRKGKVMTVSPAGYVSTLGKPTDAPTAFPLQAGEQLPLSAWIGISGAAVSTGIGQNTTLGQSLLAALVNMRLGYWWDSPVPPAGSTQRLFGDLVQRYLLREARAEYEGTHTNRWYLSDGGHFENTGVYELVRRRVPLIVACDNGADPDYEFSNLVNLVRKIRIDFDAETVFLGSTELDQYLGTANGLRNAFGTLKEIGRESDADRGGPYATLARIRYSPTQSSTLLLIKPRISGSELPDLLRYKATNAAFPQQPTADQFFDEEQWESYFRLGQLIADTIFEPVPSSGSPTPTVGAQPTWWPSSLNPLP